jgi:hypothetical protein
MATDRLAAKYLGDGTLFVHGIPARDIMESEWERLTLENKSRIIEHSGKGGLYSLRNSAQEDGSATEKSAALEPDTRSDEVVVIESDTVVNVESDKTTARRK